MTQAGPDVTTFMHGHVGEIRFSNPPINYATADLLSGIADAIEAMDADPQVRCILLTSAGKAFCAGADLQGGDAGAAGDTGVTAIGQFYEQAKRLFRRSKPMVAAVQGAAVGAGLGMALCADFRVAAPGARFSANFVRLGFHPGFGLSCILPRLLGVQKASWMMLSAERVKPDDALAWGLVDRLASQEDLHGAALRMAEDIAANAPLAVVDVRRTLTGSFADDVADAMGFELSRQAVLRETADYAEGVAAVFERREPHFTGH